MGTNSLSQKEQNIVKSYLEQMWDDVAEKGMEKGMEKMLTAYLRQNPGSTDEAISTLFEVPLDFVRSVRKKLNKQ